MNKLVKKYFWNPIACSARPKFCDALLDRAGREKWPVTKIHDPVVLELPAPDDSITDDKVKTAFENARRIQFQTQHLVCLPNASVWGGLVRLPSGEFLKESDWRMKYFAGSEASRSRFHRHKIRLDGDCYYADFLFSSNYAHWMGDELPRLANARPFLPPKTKYILLDPVPQFKRDSLAAFGVDADDIIVVEGYQLIQCERLWYATPSNDMVWIPTGLEKVKSALLRKYGQGCVPASRRIFLSRNQASNRRRLANENELLHIIKEHGFTIVSTEQMSLAEQIRIFSESKVVLGPHGAGLTNVLFSPPHAKLLELQDVRYAPRTWFWIWTSLLNHDYYSLAGPVTESTGWLDTKFSISPKSLEQFLKSSLSAEPAKPGSRWCVSD